MDWIKVKTRELTPEEREEYPDVDFKWDMKIPNDDELVLLTDGKTRWVEVWEGIGDSLYQFEYSSPEDYENLWYMPFPEPPSLEDTN